MAWILKSVRLLASPLPKCHRQCLRYRHCARATELVAVREQASADPIREQALFQNRESKRRRLIRTGGPASTALMCGGVPKPPRARQMAVCECVALSGAVWAALAPVATYAIYAAAVAIRRARPGQ